MGGHTQSLGNCDEKAGHMQGLLHQLHDAGRECGRRLVRTPGEHDDRQQRIECAEALKCATPTFVWQTQIEQHQINMPLANPGNSLVAGTCIDNIEILQSQDSRERLADEGFVLDQQDGFLGFPFAECVAIIHLNSVNKRAWPVPPDTAVTPYAAVCQRIMNVNNFSLQFRVITLFPVLTDDGKLLSPGFPLAISVSSSADYAYTRTKLCQMET